MSWGTVIWSMTASACLTLAAIHLLVWCQRRTAWDDLLFTLISVAAAVYTGCELWMMRAETPAQFATALRWFHVPGSVIILSLVGFVRLHVRVGHPWLGWTICALLTLCLVLNCLHTIITGCGGKLWATNYLGRGATFHFTLPVSEAETKS